MDALADRVQNLSAELYNQIYTEVLTPVKRDQYIKEGYRPPKYLAISRASRAHFAESYQRSIFILDLDYMGHIRWLRSLMVEHLLLIPEIRSVSVAATDPHFWPYLKTKTHLM